MTIWICNCSYQVGTAQLCPWYCISPIAQGVPSLHSCFSVCSLVTHGDASCHLQHCQCVTVPLKLPKIHCFLTLKGGVAHFWGWLTINVALSISSCNQTRWLWNRLLIASILSLRLPSLTYYSVSLVLASVLLPGKVTFHFRLQRWHLVSDSTWLWNRGSSTESRTLKTLSPSPCHTPGH